MADPEKSWAASDAPIVLREARPASVILGWAIGILVFVGVVAMILRFADMLILLDILRSANPLWILAALASQTATYACAAAIWATVMRSAGYSQPLTDLLKLAVVELFANQAIPTGGLSGSIIVVRGLIRRGVPVPIAVTALLISALSYYAAYLVAAALAFLLLWRIGDLSDTWAWLSIAFAVLVALIAIVLLFVARSRGRFIPGALRRSPRLARLSKAFEQVRIDMVGDVRILGRTVPLQLAIFILDAVTLWLSLRSLGAGVGLSRAFLAFVLASVVATLSPLPLGLGSFEGTCVAVLHLLGVRVEAALAATLVFRGFSFWLPMLPGLWLVHRENRTA
ncbi:lysylphosphatidylglycerol synthase transmembrane domain-containing protein [Rhizobium sp. RAF56]|uniref:lysylphosphatidylglycerol synthase transmembrane domain-containing protein n=1 Tax=Rhizobium sp. RAF56 TaxID=3233062 RepID=UPI003F952480